jgi:hypothetical protein
VGNDTGCEVINIAINMGKAALKLSVATSEWILNMWANRLSPDAHQSDSRKSLGALTAYLRQLSRFEDHDKISGLQQRRSQPGRAMGRQIDAAKERVPRRCIIGDCAIAGRQTE